VLLLLHDAHAFEFGKPVQGRPVPFLLCRHQILALPRGPRPDPIDLRAVADSVGPVHGVVGHSLGGAAAVLAIRDGLAVERAILLAAPADVTRFSTTFADHLRLPLKARAAMRRNLELRLDARWDELHIPTIVRKFRTPVLLINDRGDPDVPFRHAEEVAAAWPGARVLATDGLGHRAVLRDPTVVRSAVAFLTKAANR